MYRLSFISKRVVLVLMALSLLHAQEEALVVPGEKQSVELDRIMSQLKPYTGPSMQGVDVSTLKGKVLAGYQGWFNVPADGAKAGWFHFKKGDKFSPGNCVIDMWPDLTDFPPEERYATDFKHADGSVAEVFSSYNQATVNRHFQWMKEYGIDGGLLQRFAVELKNVRILNRHNVVMRNVQHGANSNGRGWAVMYDLTGLQIHNYQWVIDEWRNLTQRMKIGRDDGDKAYLRPQGKPLVVVWGIGFEDKDPVVAKNKLLAAERIIDFLKDDSESGGNFVALGVPYRWRELGKDSMKDPDLHRVLAKADLISPWSVGRYHEDVVESVIKNRFVAPDKVWCDLKSIEYMPVIFPGFSWRNLKGEGAPLNEIPRLKGEFLWRQACAAVAGGAGTIYVAMFDELNEATSIFKCTDNPPVGDSQFLTMDGLPSDHYLWLTGMIGRMLRGEILKTPTIPRRDP